MKSVRMQEACYSHFFPVCDSMVCEDRADYNQNKKTN